MIAGLFGIFVGCVVALRSYCDARGGAEELLRVEEQKSAVRDWDGDAT